MVPTRVNAVQFRFGRFEFDLDTLQLRRSGVVVDLQSQPSRVLACLVQNTDRVVSREELRSAIWGQETFVDFDRGLNFCVSQIRSALKDDPANPVYIRTVPKQGYQFIAPVERMAPELASRHSGTPPRIENRRAPVLVAVLILSLLGLSGLGAYWFWSHLPGKQTPIVAVVRFDNETGQPELTHFSDALTDNVVVRLSEVSAGRYRVVGNGQILRLPREQRDLNAIASSLRARYVILGQVQSGGGQIRILAHLIQMPEQTHLSVTRIERALTDELSFESEVAQRIADQFSPRLTAAGPASSHLAASR